MPTFEAIQQEIKNILDIDNAEMDAEQKEAVESYLDELASAETQKVDAFACFIREEAARVEYYKDESKRLASKAKTAESRIGYLKNRYGEIMRESGYASIKGNAYKLSLRSALAVAVTAQVDTLPEEYIRVKTTKEPDKIKIKDALQQGKEIPGCSLATTYNLQVN